MHPLQQGIKHPEVGNWQRFLTEQGFTDWTGRALTDDEEFGERTRFATMQWQARRNLEPNGIVTDNVRFVAQSEGFIPFRPAKFFKPASSRNIRLIVIHTMEYPETPAGAEWCAGFFADPRCPDLDPTGKKQYDGGKLRTKPVYASAHYAVDEDSIVQCVRDRDIAYGAPGANHDGIHVEHVGYASQTAAQWADASSTKVLEQSARLVKKLMRKYNIPVARLSVNDVRDGKARGVCGHDSISEAFKGSNHMDPGKNFPWSMYLNLLAKT